MFWPFILPFQITCVAFATAIVAVTWLDPRWHWKRLKTAICLLLLAILAFVPSCTGVMFAINEYRFGRFSYQEFEAVNDFRIERFLPPAAAHIELDKQPNGHRARYRISEPAFRQYIDGLWNQYGDCSACRRDELDGEGQPADAEDFNLYFADLGWPPLKHAIQYHSPVEDDGGGATYYFDLQAGFAYHRAGYW